MRADRLLSILLILQRRRVITAKELSRELGVSVRTIARDMDALSTAGVPVYAERGIGGGWRLVEEYHTDLTGMTQSELGALRLLNVPEPLGGLQAGADLQSALLKLFAAAAQREERGGRQAQLIYLDWAGMANHLDAPNHLKLLYSALLESRQVHLHYGYMNFIDVEQQVDPLGLVARGGSWYLVYSAAGRLRAMPLSELFEVRVLDTRSQRDDTFDLTAAWRRLRAEMTVERSFQVRVLISPQMYSWLEVLQRGRSFRIGRRENGPRPDGWYAIELFFENFEAARAKILAWGGGVEVLEPLALRLSIGDYAAQIVKRYQGSETIASTAEESV